MKIFKNFVCIVLSALLVIPAISVMAEPAGLATRDTEFGEEHIIWEEDFDDYGTMAECLAVPSTGYAVGENNNPPIESTSGVNIVSGAEGNAMQIGDGSGTQYWFQKSFDKTWTEMLADGGVAPSDGDYIVFSADVYHLNNVWIFRSNYDGSNKYLAYFMGSGRIATATNHEFLKNAPTGNWYDTRIVYQYDYKSNELKYFNTIVNDIMYNIENNLTGKYYKIPLTGLSHVQMRANWGASKIDNIRISYVAKPDSLAKTNEFDKDAVNPYYPLKLSFNRGISAGTASLKYKGTEIDSAAAPGNELVLNSDGNLLDFGEEYTLELSGVKDYFGNTMPGETINIKTLELTDTPSSDAAPAQLENISILLASEPSDTDVELCYSDGSTAVTVAGAGYIESDGNYILNVPIDQNLRANTQYSVKLNGASLYTFTTKDCVNVSRAAFSAGPAPLTSLSADNITVSVDVDNETGYLGISKAALMVAYFNGDRLEKLECGRFFDINQSSVSTSLATDIDLSGVTLGAASAVKTFVVDENMRPLSLSSVLE